MQAPLQNSSPDYNAPGRITPIRAAMLLVVGTVGVAALLPLDPHAAAFAAKFQANGPWKLGGDLKRELEFVQQFGAFTCCVIVWGVIILLDQARRWRLACFLAGTLANVVAANTLKMTLGRPRPLLQAPYELTLPWQTHQFAGPDGPIARHAWDTSQLWSFPSSHTSAAFLLAVFLSRMYPRLTPLMILLAATVGLARIILFAHYPSDVIGGATIGALIGLAAYDHAWAARLAPASWRPMQPRAG